MGLWTRIAELLITPPGVVVLMLLLTFIAYLRRAWLGAGMLVLSTATLVALSLPLTAHWLINGLQNLKPPELVPMAEKGPQASLYVLKDSLKDPPTAIVVLGHGRNSDAPEYDFQDTVSAYGLERLRYAAFLQRKTGLPILVSGGAPDGEATAEADFMQKVLVEEFRVPVKWVERESRTTQENARYSQTLLSDAKVHHVYLVTHSWHMRRAARVFESAGIKVTSAPTGFHTLERNTHAFHSYLPSASGMQLTALALHERLGFIWYNFKDNDAPIVAPLATTPEATPAQTPKKK
jgi:uncharacterized SAM-binding protein YcdF (DUF218 family)